MKKIAFTIVLNGMPFLRDQYDIIPECFDHWYIIEGAVLPTLDTNWCQNINNEFFSDKKLSIDGTTEFLNSVANDKITVIRKNDFWLGKLEMCNSFMKDIKDCILMQIDVDEIWDINKLKDILFFAENNEGFDGMMFKCNYYVGPDLVITNENGYGDMWYEWCRLWKIKNQTTWISHEPPRIKGCVNFLNKQFTNNKDWVFEHYAYVNENQLKFKENFYGYTNALNNWKNLQNCEQFPCKLNNYLPWVDSNTIVKKIKKAHLISTSACIDDESRTVDYINSFNHLKKFKNLFESVTLIETVSYKNVNYLEDSGFTTYYSKLGNPFPNKGANWVFHIEDYLKSSTLKNDDIIIFITGRYLLINNNVINIILKYFCINNYEFVAKEDKDIYQNGTGVHTFFIIFKKHKFLEFTEWYKQKSNYDSCVELELKNFMNESNNCLILNKNTILGVETNLYGLNNLKKIS